MNFKMLFDDFSRFVALPLTLTCEPREDDMWYIATNFATQTEVDQYTYLW